MLDRDWCGPETKIGDRVILSDPNAGEDDEIVEVKRWLVPGNTYTVIAVRVLNYKTKIQVKEHPERWFNSIQFSPIPKID